MAPRAATLLALLLAAALLAAPAAARAAPAGAGAGAGAAPLLAGGTLAPATGTGRVLTQATSKPAADSAPKSGDAKSGDAKSGDAKSGDTKSGDAKEGDAKATAATQTKVRARSSTPGRGPHPHTLALPTRPCACEAHLSGGPVIATRIEFVTGWLTPAGQAARQPAVPRVARPDAGSHKKLRCLPQLPDTCTTPSPRSQVQYVSFTAYKGLEEWDTKPAPKGGDDKKKP
jgi:hypothetical protein